MANEGRRIAAIVRWMTAAAWLETFRAIRRKAGLGGLQARDPRRTGVVNLARAGATAPEIAVASPLDAYLILI